MAQWILVETSGNCMGGMLGGMSMCNVWSRRLCGHPEDFNPGWMKKKGREASLKNCIVTPTCVQIQPSPTLSLSLSHSTNAYISDNKKKRKEADYIFINQHLCPSLLYNMLVSWKVSNGFNFVFILYAVPSISFQTFFVWALLLIVHTWNSSPLQSNLLRLQCTCCTIPTTSGRSHRSPLVWACQWPSLQPLSSPQLSHNDSLWA